MEGRNLRYQQENQEKASGKKTWKFIGTLALALLVAIVTVIAINL